MRFEDRIGLTQFLLDFPGMRVRPSPGRGLLLEGYFAFRADHSGGPVIEDNYTLSIRVPNRFPDGLPVVKEVGGRIPHHADHHVYDDGSLCLGSPLRLRLIAAEEGRLSGFAIACIVPFLYAASHRSRFGGSLPFGELAHGAAGVFDDYMDLLGLDTPQKVVVALELMGMKNRLANKRQCPCGCGQRLGVCQFNETVREIRQRLGRVVLRAMVPHLRRSLPLSP